MKKRKKAKARAHYARTLRFFRSSQIPNKRREQRRKACRGKIIVE